MSEKCCCGGHCHEHEHEHTHEHDGCACGGCHHEKESKTDKWLLAAAALFIGFSFIPTSKSVSVIILIVALALAVYPIVFGFIKNIKYFSLGETELMLIAIVAASILGEFREAALVAILYRLGEILEEKAVANSRKSINAISKIQQDHANLIKEDGKTEKVKADSVAVGSLIKILPYERFPIDGIVIDGSSTADASAVTGESLPVELEKGDEVKSGMINGSSALTVRTTCAFGESTASRIVRMVE